jgi:hypothetical protein
MHDLPKDLAEIRRRLLNGRKNCGEQIKERKLMMFLRRTHSGKNSGSKVIVPPSYCASWHLFFFRKHKKCNQDDKPI